MVNVDIQTNQVQSFRIIEFSVSSNAVKRFYKSQHKGTTKICSAVQRVSIFQWHGLHKFLSHQTKLKNIWTLYHQQYSVWFERNRRCRRLDEWRILFAGFSLICINWTLCVYVSFPTKWKIVNHFAQFSLRIRQKLKRLC